MQQNLPSVQEMEQELAKVTAQADQAPVPQVTGQTNKTKNTAQAATNIQLASSGQGLSQTEATVNFLDDLYIKAKKWAVKAIGLGLTFQGLYGIYVSVLFIFVQYPELEHQLAAHLITEKQVSDFAVRAFMIIVSTVLSMFFALRLTVLQTKTAQRIQTMMALLLVLANALLHDYFLSLNTSQIMVDIAMSILTSFKNLPSLIFGQIGFLEKDAAGNYEAVWYQ